MTKTPTEEAVELLCADCIALAEARAAHKALTGGRDDG